MSASSPSCAPSWPNPDSNPSASTQALLPADFNLAAALGQLAATAPFRPALIYPAGRAALGPSRRGRYCQWNYRQLDALCDRYARGLGAKGVGPGDRALVLLRPGIDLLATLFALFKVGAVPALVDPGMGRRAFLQCVAETEPTVLVAIPTVHVLRRAFPGAFRTLKRALTARDLASAGAVGDPVLPAPGEADAEAAVFFTSGSTGIPKGVVYSRRMMAAQVNALRRPMALGQGEIHLAVFYAFALFNPALGATTVVPDMDPRRPAAVDPALLVEAIDTFGVTLSMGSPTVWRRVADYCLAHGVRLPSLTKLMLFGAPIYPDLVADLKGVLGETGRVYTPYGATEALPVTQVDDATLGATAEGTWRGGGGCVGRPVGEVEVRVIRPQKGIIASIGATETTTLGEPGEIIVRGPAVSRAYLHRPAQTKEAKIAADGDGGAPLWHRMGDIGYFDDDGRLWFCGRHSHGVVTSQGNLWPVCCEAIFNRHPEVLRTALVGVGDVPRQRPAIVVEPKNRRLTAKARQSLAEDLKTLGQANPGTADIDTFLFYPGSFPVDVRHNAKIRRDILAQWAAQQSARGEG
ncbi:MAG: fatty acid CoA ligase family protein [Candidatus Competibacterales bacterium]